MQTNKRTKVFFRGGGRQIILFLGNRVTRQFVSGKQGNRLQTSLATPHKFHFIR